MGSRGFGGMLSPVGHGHQVTTARLTATGSLWCEAARPLGAQGHQGTTPLRLQPPRPWGTRSPRNQAEKGPGHRGTKPPEDQAIRAQSHQGTRPPEHNAISKPGRQATRPQGHQENRPPGHKATMDLLGIFSPARPRGRVSLGAPVRAGTLDQTDPETPRTSIPLRCCDPTGHHPREEATDLVDLQDVVIPEPSLQSRDAKLDPKPSRPHKWRRPHSSHAV